MVKYGSTKLRVSEAKFIVATETGFQKGNMLFWNENVNTIEKLSLGKVYRFSALIKSYSNSVLMFFIPNYTRFQVLTPEEEGKIGF